MKLLIAIHVSFSNSHVNRWTGCSAVFLEGVVHFKMRHCWRDTERVRIWRSIYPCNFMGWFQGSCHTFRADGAYGSKGHDIHPHRCPRKEQNLILRLMQYLLLRQFTYFSILKYRQPPSSSCKCSYQFWITEIYFEMNTLNKTFICGCVCLCVCFYFPTWR